MSSEFVKILWILPVLVSSAASAQQLIQEVVPISNLQPPVMPGPNAWGAGVKLGAAALAWLDEQALKSNINDAVEALQPQIDAAMPAAGGVLVVVGLQQSTVPNANGDYHRSVLEAHVGESGKTAKETLDSYLSKPRLVKGPAQGFDRRNVYFWISKK